VTSRLTLIALALLAIRGNAADFSLSRANTADIDRSNWNCEDCQQGEARTVGTAGVSAGAVDSSNDHIANRFGAKDGGFAAAQATARRQNEGPSSQTFRAENLGMESGYGRARHQGRGLDMEAQYSRIYSVESDTATTRVRLPGDNFELVEDEGRVTLDRERERVGLAADYDYTLFGLALRTFGEFHHETIDGNDSNSLNNIDRRPVNYPEPVDYTQDLINIGTELAGNDWLASLSYLGSQFDNDQDGVFALDGTALKALAPENESHTILGQGNYRFGRTRLSARFAREWLEQDERYVTAVGVPPGITNYDGDVDVIKGNARLTTVLTDTLRLAVRYDYYDRDNGSPVFAFDQTISANGSGNPQENVRYDLTRHRLGLDTYWRMPLGMRLDTGYFGEFIERDPAAREDTDEHGIYGKIRHAPAPAHRLSAELRYSKRDGSSYRDQADNNPLLRQYHLADRDRVHLEASWLAEASETLTLDLTARYTEDDYDDTEIGLLNVADYGYDVNASYRLSEQVRVEAYGGQQWIDQDQEGSQALAEPDWQYDVDDRFDYVGAGLRWDGLLEERLSLGADYIYSQSDSDTKVDPGEDYGDYYQWSHSARLFADYAWRDNTSVRLDYRYERHRDFNFADVEDEDISGLTTLGILGDRYNAHLLMLTFTFSMW
jgi:MtrB/PioB family decaheme-associated outer membrane protein